MMVTDPPYGVGYRPEWRNEAPRGKTGKVLGAKSIGQIANDDVVDWSDAFKNFVGDVAYIWHAGIHAGHVQNAMQASGLEVRSQIVWNKQSLIIGRGAYHWKHEPCWYAVKKGSKAYWRGGRKQSTVWDVSNLAATGDKENDGATGHGTQKPVELFERAMRNHGKKGDYVYDPFVGSGTAVIAAERRGRRCLAMDVDPIYVDVAVARWERLTGKKAVKES
jgi:DNA modification methylase